jgi:3-deoxy-D-manno-octulosonic-acid transferase
LPLLYRLYRFLSSITWVLGFPWTALRRAAGGTEWTERTGNLPPITPGGLWIHAASVGEVAAVAPLVRALSSRGERVLLTVLTPTGREVADRTLADHATVSFAPLDAVHYVRRSLSTAAPRALLLVETELWPNLIFEASAAGAVVGIVNGRLSERTARRYAGALSPVRELAGSVAFAACQSDVDARRFTRIGIAAGGVATVGNMKFDGLGEEVPESQKKEIRRRLALPGSATVVVFGSIRPLEEEPVALVVRGLTNAYPAVRIIVAPRHLDRVARLVKRLESTGVPSVLRSQIADTPGAADAVTPAGVPTPTDASGPASAVAPADAATSGREASPVEKVIVLDSTGELPGVYAIASLAFVGGSLAAYGGHNPLEPALQGVPVIFGPHTESCRDSAELLVRSGAALVARGAEELFDHLSSLLSSAEKRERAAAGAREAIRRGRGATARTLAILERAGVIDA